MIYLPEYCDSDFDLPGLTTQSHMFQANCYTQRIHSLMHHYQLLFMAAPSSKKWKQSWMLSSPPYQQCRQGWTHIAVPNRRIQFAWKSWSSVVQDGQIDIPYQQQWRHTGKLGSPYLFTITYCCLTAVLLFLPYRKMFWREYTKVIKESLDAKCWLKH